MKVSAHASRRMQQRAIAADWVWLLKHCGETLRQKGGTEILRMPPHTVDRLRNVLKKLDQLEQVYVVLSEDGTVITVAHQVSQLRRRRTSRCSPRTIVGIRTGTKVDSRISQEGVETAGVGAR